MESKYIIIDNDLQVFAVCFPGFIEHAQMASHWPKEYCIRAGFMTITDDDVNVYGKSTSLNLSSDPSDAIVIKRSLGFTQI